MLEDKHLLVNVRSGNKKALHAIYEKYKNTLLTIAEAMLNDTSAAEEVLHDVFVSFAGRTGNLTLHESLKDYLITSTISRVRDKFQARTFQVVSLAGKASVKSQQDVPLKSAADNEMSLVLGKAISKISFEQREVIVLHLKAGLKFRQIARLQNISVNTAKGRYLYGLEKLCSLLNIEAAE